LSVRRAVCAVAGHGPGNLPPRRADLREPPALPAIERTLFIRAQPEAVFDLITRVEDFSRYSRIIQEVRGIGSNTYHWIINVAGIELDWDSVVTEARRPHRFTWRSIRGIENGGAFDLKPARGGTEVCFTMEYRLASPILERIIDNIAAPIMRRVATEVLEQVRRRLESAPGTHAR